MIRAALLLLLLSFAPSPAAAAEVHRITLDPGGSLGERIVTLNRWRMSHDRVIVDGLCLSACTLITALIPDERVCVTPRAIFGFHSAHTRNPFTGERTFAKEATRIVWQMYPWKIKKLLFEYGWEGPVEHDELVYIPAEKLYPLCSPEEIDPLVPTSPEETQPEPSQHLREVY